MFSFLTAPYPPSPAQPGSSAPAQPAPRPAHHANAQGTAFTNPWADLQPSSPPSGGYLAWLRSRAQSLPSVEFAREHPVHVQPVQVIQPDFALPGEGSFKSTWLGHAGFLVQLTDDTSVLFDPVFGDRAGPAASAGGYAVGPARWNTPPCNVQDLPTTVRFVAISHNHYDHLDHSVIVKLHELRGTAITYLVPLGNKPWFRECGIPEEQIVELDWWQDHVTSAIPASDEPSQSPTSTTFSHHRLVRFTCVPAQHNSGRSLLDQRTTLWCGWVAELFSPPSSSDSALGPRVGGIYHAGDTGYGTPCGPAPFFAEIGDRFGPIDLALIPVWRGGSLSWVAAMGLKLIEPPAGAPSALSTLHASPAEGLAIAKAVKARHALAMHFGTFVGSAHEAVEPLVEIALLRRKGVAKQQEIEAKNQAQPVEKTPEEETEGERAKTTPTNKAIEEDAATAAARGWFGFGRATDSPSVSRQATRDGTESSVFSQMPIRAQDIAAKINAGDDDEFVNEAAMWREEGGFGWLDIGGSAVLEWGK